MTFFNRTNGLCVFRDPNSKRNIIWKEAISETASLYKNMRDDVEKVGYKIAAIVLDGKQGIRNIFSDIPVQMCHFHQKMIITRYLTTRPKLLAGKELKEIASHICQSNEVELRNKLFEWHCRWADFIIEKTIITNRPKKWHYTHKRLRSAYRSLIHNLPYLYTYQKYPELNIPNTTNSLDACFSRLKDLIRVHRGYSNNLKWKLINAFLLNEKKR
jgi:hypothetical protein